MATNVVKGTDALGIRKVYEDLIRDKTLKTIFRPADPKYGELYKQGSLVELRIIERPGSVFAGIEPVYHPDRFWVKISHLVRVKIEDLDWLDFLDSSPDVQSVTELRYHLGMIYNKPVTDFGLSDIVVKITFDYLRLKDIEKELEQSKEITENDEQSKFVN